MEPKRQLNRTEINQFFEAEFGVNANYVNDLLQLFEQNPAYLDDEWKEYFSELLGRTGGEAPVPVAPKAAAPVAAVPAPAPAPAPAPVAPVSGTPAPAAPKAEGERLQISGPALKIAENMAISLGVPTATTQRQIPIRLLDENRRVINQCLAANGRKVSFTHLIARAIVKALQKFPQMNDSFEESNGASFRVRNAHVNIGIAVDMTRKDGTRSLLVPNIKAAETMRFDAFLDAYDDTVKRARNGKLQVSDFQGTTISLTNPGTLGTTASNPRLMAGQGCIVATGSIEFPPEYMAMSPEMISRLGISKVMTITSTYDHRIIQGAESGGFLAYIDEMLRGKHNFYTEIFEELLIPYRPYEWATDDNPSLLGESSYVEKIRKHIRVMELINAYRVRGHLIADIDPLGRKMVPYHPELDIKSYGLTIWDLDREFITDGLGGQETATLREIVERIHRYYCGKVGIEYRHISSPEEKKWIRQRVEIDHKPVPTEVKKQILWKLISAEQFEKFLAVKYLGQKRFSVEGAEGIVAVLDQLVESAAHRGIEDLTIGMAHRGRLNILANVIGKFCERIFTSFEGSIHPDFPHDTGDVKYHQGAVGYRETAEGHRIKVEVLPNPSHLEFIDPVVQGVVRAKQDKIAQPAVRPGVEINPATHRVMALLIHGDSAFAGEGIVPETLNLSQLQGYSTGGTIHIIINNQLGFTTTPEESRSSTYSTDVAKMVQAPIFHVNGDDLDEAWHVLQIALDYRQEFRKDIVIDVLGFRRHGHNEGDEPTYTQPVMYRIINAHPGVRELYSRKLIKDGVMTPDEVQQLIKHRVERYENALLGAKEILKRQEAAPKMPPVFVEPEPATGIETGFAADSLKEIIQTISTVPRGFNVNPKIASQFGRREKMLTGEAAIDWGTAEAMAFGSLMIEGIPVRLSGQDSVRGTFSQRHSALYDTVNGSEWMPLGGLKSALARFQVYDSPLSEAGVLGFELGYSIEAPNELVLWEAQFGDFANVAQAVIDQFIVCSEERWRQTNRLVMLLPHGYEGQGPEHSSARLERFLQLCSRGNIQVANCTTAAQYFHLLRRQMKMAENKPLVVMTPKSLLRLPAAGSNISEFIQGEFHPILPDVTINNPAAVNKVLICSGKVYYDLAAERQKLKDETSVILRMEQFYPWPKSLLRAQLDRYPNATEIRWVQEEPFNMGGWSFVHDRLPHMLNQGQKLVYVGRSSNPSPATGSHTIHHLEQKQILENAFRNN